VPRAGLALLLHLLLGIHPAGAAPERLTSADAAEIRAVIHRQIDAFQRDDARGAFELASPGVREAFGTPERFLAVVRTAYQAVYRPARLAFREMLVMGDGVVQPVEITDRSGDVWLAYYGMQRQADGSWKTSGCHLVQPARTWPARYLQPAKTEPA
jgi:hypothetical protein